jgi:hypothetical protein
MPGDRLLPRAQYRCTRAITIGASSEKVWPWLVQVGCLRGGWYADDLLDNFARPSVRRIVPELQDLRVGQWLAWVPKPSERTAFVVDSFARPSWLLWRSPNGTWAWRLIPHGSDPPGHPGHQMTREAAWCPANLISTTISRQCVAASASSWA